MKGDLANEFAEQHTKRTKRSIAKAKGKSLSKSFGKCVAQEANKKVKRKLKTEVEKLQRPEGWLEIGQKLKRKLDDQDYYKKRIKDPTLSQSQSHGQTA